MDAKKEQRQNTWERENRERIILIVPKGCKDTIKDRADKQGDSVNGYINRLIAADLDNINR